MYALSNGSWTVVLGFLLAFIFTKSYTHNPKETIGSKHKRRRA